MSAPIAAPAAVVFDRVTRRFGIGEGAVDALADVSLDIPRGSIFGVLGESGAGKSTLLRLMNGLDHPTSGRVLVGGTDLASLAPRELRTMRHRIGVVFQHFNLVGNLTARANVALPLRLQHRRDPERVAAMMEFVGLSALADRHPAQLSGGQQQRVAIARALVTDPELLLCDEPTSALDTHTTAEILDLLQATRAEFGTTIALVTHELDAVQAVCDAAAVFERGVLLDTVAVPRTTRQREERYLDHVRSRLAS
ncbi:methionine ABC transporter ATP-binding protein [Leucobacter chromiiresistens]|uniref:ABC-type methionine transport system, ATPase component n=1 Tax=Leucobacter chromiiresistens TaxID=1079994 RepID=A0A1H1BJA3_9MICO|nr:ATP-binding cassette domain-containing protein [Leucobacter chromiiresistens]SDQ52028.1 ABC-type methionine transport system, ATPase component [Leucobacter chromiiresistens]